MLKKLCDKCGCEMDIDNEGFRIEINTSKDEIIELFGDLCEKCEKDLVEIIKVALHGYGIESDEKEEEINEENINYVDN